jgi:cell division protein ZapE
MSSVLSPLRRYQQDLERDDFSYDASQEVAVKHLQRLYDDLVKAQQNPQKTGFLAKMFPQKTANVPLKGLYFWGGVGRGKTYLMDTFFDSLPFERKSRTHFHRFMQRVHTDLRQLEGQKKSIRCNSKKICRRSLHHMF